MAKTDDIDFGKSDSMPHEVKMVITGIIAFICLVIFLIIIFGAWYTIDAGDRGVLLTFGKASTTIEQPGFHFKLPIVQSVVVYSIRTQTISFDNPTNAQTVTPSEYDALSAASKDLQNVQIAVVINYHINEADVLNIYTQYGDPHTYQVNILEPIIRNAIKATSAHYNAADLVDNRSEVVTEATQLLTTDFAAKSAVLDNLNIVNFLYSPQFTQAIEDKVTAAQNALTEQNKLLVVQYQAQQRVEEATGEANAISIQVKSINQAGGANYIALQTIARWDGKLPLVVGSNSVPFIDMRTLGVASAISTSTSSFTAINDTNLTS